MSLSMVHEGHKVHAIAMRNEIFHLAWGNLPVGYPDPWDIEDDSPPDNISVAIDEEITRDVSRNFDLLSHVPIQEGLRSEKIGDNYATIVVYQGNTTYVKGTDFEITDGDRIDWSIGGSSPADGTTYNAKYRYYDENINTLANELGRRKATQVGYVVEDPNGDIIANNTHWSIVTENRPEITDIEVSNAGDITPGSYFKLFEYTGDYYVWFTIDGDGTDPKVQADSLGPDESLYGSTGIKVELASGDDANTVAQKMRDSIDAMEVFGSIKDSNIVTVSNQNAGPVEDPIDSTKNPTYFIFTVTQQGAFYPTRSLYISFKFEATEAMDKNIYQLGIYLNTQKKDPVSAHQMYLTPDQIEDPGKMYMIENIAPFPRSPGKREIFEYVITF